MSKNFSWRASMFFSQQQPSLTEAEKELLQKLELCFQQGITTGTRLETPLIQEIAEPELDEYSRLVTSTLNLRTLCSEGYQNCKRIDDAELLAMGISELQQLTREFIESQRKLEQLEQKLFRETAE